MRAQPLSPHRARDQVSRWVRLLANETNALRASEQFRHWCQSTAALWEYSFLNRCLIDLQRRGAKFVAGKAEWQRRGREVRPGIVPIWILAPSHAAGARFVMVPVFDLRDTFGPPLVSPSWRLQGGTSRLSIIEQAARRLGFELRDAPPDGHHLGHCDGSVITIDETLDGAERLVTIAHECAHGLLHSGDRRHSIPERRRELEAEATAYVVARALGQRSTAPKYLVGLGLNPGELERSLKAISDASRQILSAVKAVTRRRRGPRSAEPRAPSPRSNSARPSETARGR